MRLIKSYGFILCLAILFSNILITKAYSIPFGQIFKGIGKIFKQGADNVPNAGKVIDDVGGIKKTEDGIISSNSDVFTTKTADKLNNLQIKNTSNGELLELHGIKNADKIADAVDLSELDLSNLLEKNAAINTFRIVLWTGRVFRVSNNYNNPDKDKFMIKCNGQYNQIFYFTALLEDKKKWLLLTENIKNQNQYYSKPLDKEELFVLVDNENYLMFSTSTPENKKYPLNYFIIAGNGKFVHKINMYGANSPEYLIANAEKKINQSDYNCKKL